ncbi:hypothetical protein C5708_18085 [Caulobacter sp. CCUG 60055]|uniref:aa3-type cytochrome c oxidase subunit IV n=1 Tax=Caulobacter sp. CCUG 60055 TaxID=2100090 RepID=UPI001FA7BB42|nr:aa3-type cytochrome c oxidase subunit IV [Caulobacter sp. CCUG 60055]MBQ1541222.1 aa3-type cytochrome c oxidase subunit IV [Caulobacteraceae bacterium]MCI3182156.1 hypothetical protein [Caulobacter sp. CCUG 60055]
MAEDVHTASEVDLPAHAETYHHFNQLIRWTMWSLAVILPFLTVWFCTSGGFLGGLATAVVVGVVGYYLLRPRSEGVGHLPKSEFPTAPHAQ